RRRRRPDLLPSRHPRGARRSPGHHRGVARRERRPGLPRPAPPAAAPARNPRMTGVTVTSELHHARITGIGSYRPERVVPNSEIVEAIDSSDEWIRERSGIESRHRAAPQESVVDMSEHASRAALDYAGISSEQLGAVIVATVTHPYQTPAAAPELAARFGSTAPAFDLSAACAGFCHALSVANDMVRVGTAEHVLVVGVEKMLDFTDPQDRGSAFIFGDGAGAAVVSRSQTHGIGPTVWGSDGEKKALITSRNSWMDLARDRDLPWPAIVMEGPSVFRWAVWS